MLTYSAWTCGPGDVRSFRRPYSNHQAKMRGVQASSSTRPTWTHLLVLIVASLASGAGASDFDPWDEPVWVPMGGNITGPPFIPLPPNATEESRLRDSAAYVSSVEHLPTWALKMLQSSSELREGIQNAFPPQLGKFEGCKSFASTSDYLEIVGKYCVASVTLIGPGDPNATLESVTHSVVVENYLLTFCASPGSTPVGLSRSLQDFFNRTMETNIQARATVNLFECKTWRREQPMHAGDISVLFILVAFGVLVVVSTCYEGLMRKKRKDMSAPSSRILVSFSLLTNVPKLISVTSGDSTMRFLFGLKFLSISWIVFGHTFYNSSILPLTNPYYVAKERNNIYASLARLCSTPLLRGLYKPMYHLRNQWGYSIMLGEILFSKEWTKLLILNESVAVDTFFLISGMLMVIGFLREQENGVPFRFFSFYLHRILRLTPPYAMVVFFYATLLYRLGSGPAWDSLVGYNTEACRINWWTNLLYVNNYVNLDKPCMNHSWYLAVDTQFYVLAPFIIFPMYKKRYFRLYIFPLLLLMSVAAPFIITAVMDLPGAMFFNWKPEDVSEVFTNVYTRAYCRAGPYLVGIGLGFLLHKYKDVQLIIPKYWVALGWTLSTTSCLAVIFGVYRLMQLDHAYNVWESSLYAGLHRTAWAMGVAWVIFACCHGYAGPVNAILSWKLLTPLGRLTYCIYLSHYIVILYFAGSSRAKSYFSVDEVVRDFFGNLVIAVFVSAALSLAFESPFIGISKAFVKRGARAPRSAIPKDCVDEKQSNSHGSPGKTVAASDEDFPSTRGEFSVEEGSRNDVKYDMSEDADASPPKLGYCNGAYEATP